MWRTRRKPSRRRWSDPRSQARAYTLTVVSKVTDGQRQFADVLRRLLSVPKRNLEELERKERKAKLRREARKNPA